MPLPSTGGEVEALVRTPSGGVAYPYVEDNGNGSIGLSYQPVERGPHSIDVRYDGNHVQGSPYKFHAAPLDNNRVHAYGPGLTHGVCGDPAEFVISTRGAGAGGLALAVEGPSKADINCQVRYCRQLKYQLIPNTVRFGKNSYSCFMLNICV